MTQKERMLAGQLYIADDPELVADAARAAAWLDRYNRASTATAAERNALLVEGLGHAGRGATIRPPFHCDYGYNIHLGEGVFLNFGCTVLDVVPVRIGAGTQIGRACKFSPPTIRVIRLSVAKCSSSGGRSPSVETSG